MKKKEKNHWVVFGLRNESVRIWEKSVRKVSVFGLMYVMVDLWEKIIKVYEICDGCENIFIFLKV